MDVIEDSEMSNETLFDIYELYFHEYKQIFGNYLIKVRDEFIVYFRHNAQQFVIVVFIYAIFSFCFYFFLMRSKTVRQLGTICCCRRILIVISHPDDECMFFGPTIVTLTETPGCKVYLLCLSSGDYQSLGSKRKQELFESCKKLGIPESHIQIYSCTVLPDNPKVHWNQEVVADIVLNFIEIYSIDTVVTFDQYGVSNHPNHISIFYAMAFLCLEKKLPPKCTIYVLESVSRMRKYMAYMDIPLTCFLSSTKYIVPMKRQKLIREAMKLHKSQYVWFRKLYMAFSRYIYINSFKEINVLELELEFEIEGIRN